MAGNSAITRSAWPQGSDGWIVIASGQVNVEASKTDHVWDVITVPFKCDIMRVEHSSQTVAITNAITYDVADNEGTPNVFVNNQNVAAVTAGASTAPVSATMNIAPGATSVLAGAVLIFRYTSGASDTSVGTRVRLWVRPKFS